MVLEVRGLYKRFGGVQAVDDFFINIGAGEIVSTIGPNGAGKTTVFNMVTGLVKADQGHVRLNGVDLSKRPSYERTRAGLARTFQNLRIFESVSVLDNVVGGQHVRTRAGVMSSIVRPSWVRREEERAQEIALECLRFVNPALLARSHERASSLPYGLQRQVEVARALASEPKVLMLDEPAAGLNDVESEEMMHLVDSVRNRGISVWLIEHDMAVVMGISDRVVVVDQGRVIAVGTPAEVQSDERVIEAYLGGDVDESMDGTEATE